MLRFENKIVAITGGANGLGRGMAEQYLRDGAKVAILDFEADTMQEVFGGMKDVLCVYCDVRDYDSVQAGVKAVIDHYGRIDILMNNAGIVTRQSILECTKEGWLDVMATNLNGTFYVGQAVARTMVEREIKGVIVNTCSNSARKPMLNIAPYGPSKGGVAVLTANMALEFARYGIRVNAFAPGTSRTRIAAGTINDPERSAAFLKKMPFGRFGEVQEAVSIALFLASDEASFMVGEVVYEDGGFCLP
ncbi:MAG: SDR family oxidoreductase [Oscillospiraceae bacterium]